MRVSSLSKLGVSQTATYRMALLDATTGCKQLSILWVDWPMAWQAAAARQQLVRGKCRPHWDGGATSWHAGYQLHGLPCVRITE
jgi:hypothetical protein